MGIFKFGLTIAFLLFVVPYASAVPPYEQDDDPLHARSIRVYEDIQTRDFDTVSDEDWVTFPLTYGFKRNVDTFNVLPLSPPYDINNTYFELYDESILVNPSAEPLYCDESAAFDSRIWFDPFPGNTGNYYARILFRWCWDTNDPAPPLDCAKATWNSTDCPDPDEALSGYTYDLHVYNPQGPGDDLSGYVCKSGLPCPGSGSLAGVSVTVGGTTKSTDSNGHYNIGVPSPGYVDVRVSAGSGYQNDPILETIYVVGNATKNYVLVAGADPSPCGTLTGGPMESSKHDLNLLTAFLLFPLSLFGLKRKAKTRQMRIHFQQGS